MRELPDIRSVARVRPARLYKLWEGLGYYTRARHLHEAAQVILSDHGGEFPERYEEILALPGIGRYTAGAICSIAFNQSTPVLDGNVTRVLTRLFDIDDDPQKATTKARLWRLAKVMVGQAADERADHRSARTRLCTGNCSLLNQSLMELGAVICTPRQPQCVRCPAQAHCQAYRKDRVLELPRRRSRARITHQRHAVFVVEYRGCFLVRQRPTGTVNAHLWEFPHIEVGSQPFDTPTLARVAIGIRADRLEPLCTVKSVITRYQITQHAFRVQVERFGRTPSGHRWLRLPALESRAFSSAHRRILAVLRRPTLSKSSHNRNRINSCIDL
jgi:A/G-specific adenine glycosylase